MEVKLSSRRNFLLTAFVGLLALECATMVLGFDYEDALDKTLLFFEAQRSGKLPHNNRVKWRANSGMHDGYAQGVDLVGGYYDAGDHVKFGLPMAFSVTMMAWAAVGDGASDHLCWMRPEDMTTSRTAYKLDSSNPGSDLASETAAALAASGMYDDSITNAEEFYTSSGYTDELLWAAAWLYRATNKDYFLKYVIKNAASMGGTGWAVREFSWDNKYAGVQILLSKQYQAKADYFACACLQKNNGYDVQLTPGGLVYVREWNNMQYASSAAFLLAVYSDYLSQAKAVLDCPEGTMKPQDLLNFAKSQGDYILGENPESMSYLVGFGKKYPTQVHHRGASIASITVHNEQIGCVQGFEEWYRCSSADPNIIYGGLVGGPDKNDEYDNDRSNYEQTEPTISGTAPLVGLFSKLSTTNSHSSPYAKKAPKPYDATPTTSYTPKASYVTSEVPIKISHSITGSWTQKGETLYHHKVLIKNMSMKMVNDLKLKIEDLSGPIWGVIPTGEKNIYQVPPYLKVLPAGGELSFVYIQDGPQAKVSFYSCD
ncbi:Endoglucanase 5 [Bienertia sinuspersici]